jgi:Co/Zn/Cd efflux system component
MFQRSWLVTAGELFEHRHGRLTHQHPSEGPHRHLLHLHRSQEDISHHHDHHPVEDHAHRHGCDHGDDAHDSRHGHTHGRVDPSVIRSHEGVRAVAISLGVLAGTAALQMVVFLLSGSVALLADLIHNGGDALTAIPLGIAFFVGSRRGEKLGGYFVVAVIFVSASVAAYESIHRLFNPEHLNHLPTLAIAGALGFFGNEIAARVRLRAGDRLDSPALIADGKHARVDGFVSLGVIASAGLVAIGFERADPLVGIAITVVILEITWDAWKTVRLDTR